MPAATSAGTSLPWPAAVSQLVVTLLVAGLLGLAVRRYLRLPVLGELVGGVLLGPSLVGRWHRDWVGWVSPVGKTTGYPRLASAAAVLLVAVTIMHLDLRLLRLDRSAILRIAFGALVLPAALGMLAALALPDWLRSSTAGEATFVLFLGVALGVSALPVAAITLRQLGLTATRVGRLVIAAAALDDIAGWLLLVLILSFGISGGGSLPVVLAGLVLLALLVVLGRPPARAGLTAPGRVGEALALLTVLGTVGFGAALALLAGLEPAIGAVAAGALLCRCPPVPARVARLMDRFCVGVCAPLFLGAAGARFDVRIYAEPVVLVSGAVLLLLAVAGKLIGGYLGARSAGVPRRIALATGAGLNARGMVEILIASIGLQAGLLGPRMYGVLVSISVATSLITPPLLRLTTRGSGRGRPPGERSELAGQPFDHGHVASGGRVVG